VHDGGPVVRARVAQNGTDAHREKLLNDPDNEVRLNVAAKANKAHAQHLMNDPVLHVRREAARRYQSLHLADGGHDDDLLAKLKESKTVKSFKTFSAK
jgi:hypothetical protein